MMAKLDGAELRSEVGQYRTRRQLAVVTGGAGLNVDRGTDIQEYGVRHHVLPRLIPTDSIRVFLT